MEAALTKHSFSVVVSDLGPDELIEFLSRISASPYHLQIFENVDGEPWRPLETIPTAHTQAPDSSPRRDEATSRPVRDCATLTRRDEAILVMLYRGLTNAEIAEQLGVTARTVKGYLSLLFAKFDVTNRTELVGCAVDAGLLDSHPQPHAIEPRPSGA